MLGNNGNNTVIIIIIIIIIIIHVNKHVIIHNSFFITKKESLKFFSGLFMLFNLKFGFSIAFVFIPCLKKSEEGCLSFSI